MDSFYRGTLIRDLEGTVIGVEKTNENERQFRQKYEAPKKLAVVLPFRKPVEK